MSKQETRKTFTWRSRIAGTAAAALLVGSGAGAMAFSSPSASAHDQSASASSQSLTARVQRLEDIEDIQQLKARYFRFVDEKKHDQLVKIFTPNAKIVTDGQAFKSPKEFADIIRDSVGAAPTVHHGHMPEIQITGPNTATGIWAMEDLLTFPAGPNAPQGHNGYGQYHETYKKVHGNWLIDSVLLTRFRMDPLANWTPPAPTTSK